MIIFTTLTILLITFMSMNARIELSSKIITILVWLASGLFILWLV